MSVRSEERISCPIAVAIVKSMLTSTIILNIPVGSRRPSFLFTFIIFSARSEAHWGTPQVAGHSRDTTATTTAAAAA